MVVLLGAIAAILVGGGLWFLYRRRWRLAAMHFSAAAGPVALAVCLAVDAVRQYVTGRKDAARLSVFGAIAASVLAGVAGLLLLASREAMWMALVGAEAVTAVGVFYAAAYGHLGGGRLTVVMALRMGAVVLLLAVLFKPAVSVRVDPEMLKPPLPVLVDRSGSMAMADDANAPTRLAQVLTGLEANRRRLESAFRPHWRPFARSVEQAKSFEAAASRTPWGPGSDGTDIALAIRQVSVEAGELAIPAVLLLSDGIHNGPESVKDAAARAGVPIYVVGVGSTQPTAAGRRNIKLMSIDAPLEVARDSEASIRATFQVDGLAGVPVEVHLSEEGSDSALATATVTTDRPSALVTAELKWTAKGGSGEESSRVQRLSVSAVPHPAEAVSEDNASPLHVLVTEPRIGVLVMEGSMRPEYKFLKRLLDSDPLLQLAALVRVSENRFWASGAIGGRKVEAIPAGDEDFRGIDVIILGDLDCGFLTDAQMSAIRRFVHRGGGLMMLGGHNSFGPGGYGGTDIEAVLPVIVGGREQPQETEEFLPHLTAAGAAHPAMAGMEEFFPSPGRTPKYGGLPPLAGCVALEAAKPGATVLAVHPTRRNAAGSLVILAVQQVGAGRAAAFAADTTWRWDLPLRAMGARSPYVRFWSQLVRYLARAEVKTRQVKPSVLLRPERTHFGPGESIKVTVWALDEGGGGIEPSRLRCMLIPTGGSSAQVLTLTSKFASGLLEAAISPQSPGGYSLKAAAFDETGKEIAFDEMGLLVAGPSAEADRLARDQELLRRIAEQSGGQVVELSALGSLIEQIIERHRNPAQGQLVGQTYRLYHFPLLLGAFVVLVTVEWVLRRRWQLH